MLGWLHQGDDSGRTRLPDSRTAFRLRQGECCCHETEAGFGCSGVEAIGVNGLHAVVVAPVLVRVEMLRTGRTYELLITQHRPGLTNDGKRPPIETRLLFRGIHGRLDLDLSGEDKDKPGTVLPTFYSRAGEEVRIPKRLRQAVRAITGAVDCNGCFHCDYVRPPQKKEEQMGAA